MLNKSIQTIDNIDFTVNGKVIKEVDSLSVQKQLFFKELDASTNKRLNLNLSQLIIEELDNLKDLGFTQAFDSLNAYRKGRVLGLLTSTQQKKLKLPADEAFIDVLPNIGFNTDNGFNFSLEELDLDIISRYKYDRIMSDQDVLDAMKIDKVSSLNTSFLLQLIRVLRGDTGTTSRYIVSNFAFAMFFMIPMFGLLLMLINYRRGMLYVEHFIHSLHLHSFAFLLMSLTSIMLMLVWDIYFTLILNLTVVVLLTVYFYSSSRRMYLRGKLNTFIRCVVVAILYYFVFLFTLLIEVLFSILLY